MTWYQKRGKYGAKRTVYNDRKYDSKGEAGLAQEIDMEIRAGQVTRVEPQKTFELRGLNGKLVARHRVDFLLTMPDGSQEVREFKGFATEEWRLKRELFQDNFPHIPYVVVTARARWPAKRIRRAS